MALLRYPPFGFSVWFDRHGRRWCWRERRPLDNPDNVTKGTGFGSKRDACDACQAELSRRSERDAQDAGQNALG